MKFDFRTIKRAVFILVTLTIIFAYMQVVIIEEWWKFCDFRFRLSRSMEFQKISGLDMNSVYYDDKETAVKYYEDDVKENSDDEEPTPKFDNVSVIIDESEPSERREGAQKPVNKYAVLDLRKRVMNTTDFTEKPLMILFSSWAYSIEKQAVHSILRRNWKSWASIKPVVLTRDKQVQTDCRKSGWMVQGLTLMDRYCNGPPVLSAMFTNILRKHDAYFYGYSNADIVFGDGLRKTMEFFFYHFAPWKTKPILVVGRRYNVNFMKFRNESWNTPSDVRNMVKHGDLVIRSTDYFFTNKHFPWGQAPKVSIGRPYVVRAIIAWAIRKGYFVIDATRTIESVHLTTKDGVFASWHTKGVMCNQRVLADLHWNIPLNMGHCECAKLETFHGVNNNIQMRHRPPNKRLCSR